MIGRKKDEVTMQIEEHARKKSTCARELMRAIKLGGGSLSTSMNLLFCISIQFIYCQIFHLIISCTPTCLARLCVCIYKLHLTITTLNECVIFLCEFSILLIVRYLISLYRVFLGALLVYVVCMPRLDLTITTLSIQNG